MGSAIVFSFFLVKIKGSYWMRNERWIWVGKLQRNLFESASGREHGVVSDQEETGRRAGDRVTGDKL